MLPSSGLRLSVRRESEVGFCVHAMCFIKRLEAIGFRWQVKVLPCVDHEHLMCVEQVACCDAY